MGIDFFFLSNFDTKQNEPCSPKEEHYRSLWEFLIRKNLLDQGVSKEQHEITSMYVKLKELARFLNGEKETAALLSPRNNIEKIQCIRKGKTCMDEVQITSQDYDIVCEMCIHIKAQRPMPIYIS